MIVGFVGRKLKLYRAKRQWHKNNLHNYTRVNSLFNQDLVSVGKYTYGTINISSSNDVSKVRIGHFCSIADDVLFVINNEHNLKRISTFPFANKLFGEKSDAGSKGDIEIEDDVWIGNRVMIMSGVKIGQGAVIAAGAVVTRNIPAYSIAGGIPARVIKMRFSDDVISRLINVDYSQLSEDDIKNNMERFCQELSETDDLDWLPKKVKE